MGISAALGASLVNSMIAIAIVWWPWYARLVRGQTLRLRHEQFVDAARATGASDTHTILRHILPNCWTPIIVQITLDVGYAILTTASLSFIGFGAQPPTPEWGAMVATGKDYILDQWWMATFPGFGHLPGGDGLQSPWRWLARGAVTRAAAALAKEERRMARTVIKGGRVVTPGGEIDATIIIDGQRIAGIVDPDVEVAGDATIDATGLRRLAGGHRRPHPLHPG